MNERYRVVNDSMFSTPTRNPACLLERLLSKVLSLLGLISSRPPAIARRVRWVIFHQGSIYQERYKAQQHSKFAGFIGSVSHLTGIGVDMKSEKTTILSRNRRRYSTQYTSHDECSGLRSRIVPWGELISLRNWLSTLSNDLAEIWLYASVTKFADLFVQATTSPRLRRCSITHLCPRYSEYNQLIQTTLASFLHSRKDTLQHLVPNHKPMQDLFCSFLVIWQSSSHYRPWKSTVLYITTMILTTMYNPMPGTAFIQRNALTLRELHIATSSPIGPLSSLLITFDSWTSDFSQCPPQSWQAPGKPPFSSLKHTRPTWSPWQSMDSLFQPKLGTFSLPLLTGIRVAHSRDSPSRFINWMWGFSDVGGCVDPVI